jgi:hypothetical protein
MNEEYVKWIIASGGWIVASLTVWIGYRERKEAREESALRESLAYFTGGTQKRSVGIAFLEGKFRDDPRFQDIWIPVIANQFVYLLLQTKSDHEAHEIRNLVRMYRLLSSIKSFSSRYPGSYGDVLDSINTKLEGEKRGLLITSQTLNIWKKELEKIT